jgi:hypothetical protein
LFTLFKARNYTKDTSGFICFCNAIVGQKFCFAESKQEPILNKQTCSEFNNTLTSNFVSVNWVLQIYISNSNRWIRQNRGFGQNQKSVLFAFTNAKVGLVKVHFEWSSSLVLIQYSFAKDTKLDHCLVWEGNQFSRQRLKDHIKKTSQIRIFHFCTSKDLAKMGLNFTNLPQRSQFGLSGFQGEVISSSSSQISFQFKLD